MTAKSHSDFTHDTKRLGLRLRVLSRFEREALINWALSMLLIAPMLFFLSPDKGVRIATIVYVVLYVAVMIIPTALYVLMIVDAARVAFRRPAIFVPWLIASSRVVRRQKTERPSSPARMILVVSILGNPFASFTTELWLLAFRFNPDGYSSLRHTANQIADHLQTIAPTSEKLLAIELRPVTAHTAEMAIVTC